MNLSLLLTLIVSIAALPLEFSSKYEAVDEKPLISDILKEKRQGRKRSLVKRDPQGFHVFGDYQVARSNLTQWLDEQPEASMFYMLQNIDYPGGLLQSIKLGAVIASPSTEHPNYYYQWTRDSAITILGVIGALEDCNYTNSTLAMIVEYYISNTYEIQRVTNPSGNFDDANHPGLGEPKFLVDNGAYEDSWGRPQNDGPALRSYAIMRYLNGVSTYLGGVLQLAGQEGIHYTSSDDIYNNIIKPDLEYVAAYWSDEGFDLWEENDGTHFFTSLAQLKALRYGSNYAARAAQDSNFSITLAAEADKLELFTNNTAGYVSTELHHIVESPKLTSRGGLDTGTFAATLLTHDIGDTSNDVPFDVTNPYVLNSWYYLVSDNRIRYPVNSARSRGVAVGRYPEDVFNGDTQSEGNPWFLSTAYSAQLCYSLAYSYVSQSRAFVIDKLNYDMYNSLVANLSNTDAAYASKDNITVEVGTESYMDILESLLSLGDSFMQVILDHVNDNGQLTEEINRYTGYENGAVSLTWSSGSFLSAVRARKALVSESSRSS